MIYFLQNKAIYYFIIPALTILLSTFFKVVSRNDKHGLNMKADLTFGADLSISAILLLTSHTLTYISSLSIIDPADFPNILDTLVQIPLYLLFLSFILWIQSTIIRKWGWKDESTMNWGSGIIIPNFIGLITLTIVAYLINDKL